MSSRSKPFATALLAGGLLFSSIAASAAPLATSSAPVSPWVALSAFGSEASQASLCGAAAAIAAQGAAVVQGAPGQPGCVLPVVDQVPVAPPPSAVPPPPPAAGLGFSPLLLALAAIAAGILIYALDDNDRPESPA